LRQVIRSIFIGADFERDRAVSWDGIAIVPFSRTIISDFREDDIAPRPRPLSPVKQFLKNKAEEPIDYISLNRIFIEGRAKSKRCSKKVTVEG